MKRIKITLFWSAAFVGILLLAVQYIVPQLINSDILKGGIEKAIAREIGGPVSFEEIELSVLPRPYAVIHKGRVNTEAVSGSLKSVHLYPRFLSLLTGRLRISKLVVNTPDIALRLTSRGTDESKNKRSSAGDVFSKASEMTDSLAARFPGLRLNIRHGILHVTNVDQESCKLSGIYSQISFPSPRRARMEAEMDSSGLNCTFQREGKAVIINALDLETAVSLRDNQLLVSLKEVVLEHPRLRLFSELVLDRDARLITLTVGARNTDVPSTRETALLLGGHIPVMEKIFQIIQGGHVPKVTFRSQGKAFRDLDDTENFIIRGEMENGDIYIPGVDIALQDVNGDVVVEKGILHGEGLTATLEGSHAEKGALKIGLEGEDAPFHLDIMVDVDMSRVHSLLKELVKNKTFVDELSLIENVRGTGKGRLILGESLKSVHARVEADDVTLAADYQRIPYPLQISADRFTYNDRGITISNMRGTAGSTNVSGVDFEIKFLENPFLTISSGSADIIIDETYPWFAKLAHLPPDSHLVSPLPVASMRVTWDRGEKTLLRGDLTIDDGAEVSFDLASGDDGLDIKNLSVRDDESDADIGLALRDQEIDISFKGRLTGNTVDRYVTDNAVLRGWLQGDFDVHMQKDNPQKLTARGDLKGEDFEIPIENEKTTWIDSFEIEGRGPLLYVTEADLRLGKTDCTLSGSLDADDGSYYINADLFAGKLDFQELKEFFEGDGTGMHGEPFYHFPVQGVLRIDADSFTYGNFLWTAVTADMKVSGERINIEINKSDLCNIAFPGRVAFTPQEVSLAFQPAAEERDLKDVIACLWNTTGHMTGRYDVVSQFEGVGRGDAIVQSLKGDLVINARDGRIYKGGLLSKIFEFINVTEILRGTMPEFTKEGFSYTTIKGISEIQGSTLNIEEVVIDGSSMNIAAQGTIDLMNNRVDIELLLAPLKTADFILKNIPVIKDITKGTLVTIPLKVTGTVNEPDITYNPVKSVGEGLVGILKRTVQVPVKIIQPSQLSDE